MLNAGFRFSPLVSSAWLLDRDSVGAACASWIEVHMKQRSPDSEEALPAVDNALTLPPGRF